jgi:hypothetical protein
MQKIFSNRCWLASLLLVLLGSLHMRAALPSPDADDGGLTLPPGFHALVVADNLGRIRFISVATNGDIYIKKQGRGLLALRDSSGNGRTDVVQTFGNDMGSGTGVCVRGEWLYVSTDDAVYRYKLTPGQLVPSGAPEAIVLGLPPGQREHESKAFAFDDEGQLYVEVGCPSNASGDPDRGFGAKGVDPAELFVQHGGFWRFAPDRRQDQVRDGFHFSSGMRHALSVAWQPVSKSLFVITMGRDQLNTVDPNDYSAEDNAENPAEEMHQLKQGSNFGWPYTYWDPGRRARMVAPEFGGDNKKKDTSGKYPDPLVALPALRSHANGILHRDTISQTLSERRVCGFPWLLEPRAPSPGGLQGFVHPLRRPGYAAWQFSDLRRQFCRCVCYWFARGRAVSALRRSRRARRVSLRGGFGERPALADRLCWNGDFAHQFSAKALRHARPGG